MKKTTKKPMKTSPRPKANPFQGEGKMAEGTGGVGSRYVKDMDSSAPTKSKRPKKSPVKK